jgi:hypothetical protein
MRQNLFFTASIVLDSAFSHTVHLGEVFPLEKRHLKGLLTIIDQYSLQGNLFAGSSSNAWEKKAFLILQRRFRV